MREACVLIAFAITASGAVAAPSASVLWGPDYPLPVQWRRGLPAAESPPPLLDAHAQACFKRSTAEELIHSFDRLSAELQTLSPSLGQYEFLRAWLRSTCSLDVTSI